MGKGDWGTRDWAMGIGGMGIGDRGFNVVGLVVSWADTWKISVSVMSGGVNKKSLLFGENYLGGKNAISNKERRISNTEIFKGKTGTLPVVA